MTVASTDIKFRKSAVQTDIDSNGGRKGTALVISGARHSLFPRVTASQLAAGLVRHRKEFYCNENADDESAYGVLIFLMRPSNASDYFYLAKGTQLDTQASFARRTDISTYAATRYDRLWTGVGQLETALSGGETSVDLAMENDDFEFPNGGYLYLANNTMTGQTIASDVKIGDSVTYSGGTWIKITSTTDITYPNGWCVATDEVLTIQETTNEEFLEIATNQYIDEDIGTGATGVASPELSTLTHVTNGICRQSGLLPVVTATSGGLTRTVNVAADGSCSGYCSAGQLNMETGVWTTDITWTVAPTNATDILITYCENAWSWDGNVATVELTDMVANAYDTADTYGSGCLYEEEVKCLTDTWTETSVAGTYDDTTYPVVMYNDGTVEDTWTLTFSSASAFAVSGAYYGSVGTGNISNDFEPVNPDTGVPYFTLSHLGWAGTWAAGNTVSFKTHPSAVPILIMQEVPAGITAVSNNFLPIGAYTE